MKILKLTAVAIALSSVIGCTRIETGEVGVRIGWDKQVKPGELMPGTFNQVIIGDVLTFPVKDVSVDVKDMTPLAADNSTVKDFDMSVIYSINPSTVAELWMEKNKAFHVEHKGDIYLMYNYVHQVARNAAYKAARRWKSLEMADNRAQIESDVREAMIKTFQEEKLDTSITISQVLVRQILPADNIIESANELVKAQNEFKKKEVEVQTAKKEAERIAALNANKGAIEYMQAMALMNISEGIKEGKVQTIIVPANFNSLMLGNVKH